MLRAWISVAAGTLLFQASAGAQVSFVGLGFLPGGTYSSARGVSGDGQVVVGEAATAGGTNRAVRWMRGAGWQDLGDGPGAAGAAYAASYDGSVVVGTSHARAFRWTAAGGFQDIGASWGVGSSSAVGLSADGSVVAGSLAVQGGSRACVWSSAAGLVMLGVLPGATSSAAAGISADGLVVVGGSGPVGVYNSLHPFRWTAASGMVDLGPPPPYRNARATGVSANGLVVLGFADAGYPETYQAIRWSGGGVASVALSVVGGASADGSAVAGCLYDWGDRQLYHASVWTAAGRVDLNAFLGANGVDLTGWWLSDCTGMSADGRTIVGHGEHNGRTEAWLAWIPGCGTADFDADGSPGTDADIGAFFACLAGDCCATCGSADFNGDGDAGTDADIESFFRVLGGGGC